MKTIKQTFFLSALILIVVTGCKKYEDGPGLSLRSKSARVANDWKVDYAYDYKDSITKTADYVGETWEFTKDGTFQKRDGGITDKSGNWLFVSNKDSLQINYSTDIEAFRILRLKENEMWLRDKDEELHLVPAQ